MATRRRTVHDLSLLAKQNPALYALVTSENLWDSPEPYPGGPVETVVHPLVLQTWPVWKWVDGPPPGAKEDGTVVAMDGSDVDQKGGEDGKPQERSSEELVRDGEDIGVPPGPTWITPPSRRRGSVSAHRTVTDTVMQMEEIRAPARHGSLVSVTGAGVGRSSSDVLPSSPSTPELATGTRSITWKTRRPSASSLPNSATPAVPVRTPSYSSAVVQPSSPSPSRLSQFSSVITSLSALASPSSQPIRAGACPICLEPYAASTTLRMLPCGHSFDVGCVDEWLCFTKGACPVCRMDVTRSGKWWKMKVKEEQDRQGGVSGEEV
ncbi:hypothetical protein HDU93_005052 [Gonapodya sp. JEL0774]|nr:hypothetical protein HDU93_005052 [Gonapodya sp. JEL0774]